MAKTTIQWTENTWNPWHGCKKVSEGCRFCYMYRDKERYGQDPTTVLRSKSTFNDPLKWKEPKLIFTCSWSDFFIAEADEWRDEVWAIIKATPHHIYQILTKRPENIADRLPGDWGGGYENVWLGVSVENQKAADERISILRDIPAKIRFLSLEPLLEKIDLDLICRDCDSLSLDHYGNDGEFGSVCHDSHGLSWAIIGGESGNLNGKYKFRPSELSWYQDLVSQLRFAEIPLFVKQLGTYLAKEMNLKDMHGGEINEFPEDLQIRQMPEIK